MVCSIGLYVYQCGPKAGLFVNLHFIPQYPFHGEYTCQVRPRGLPSPVQQPAQTQPPSALCPKYKIYIRGFRSILHTNNGTEGHMLFKWISKNQTHFHFYPQKQRGSGCHPLSKVSCAQPVKITHGIFKQLHVFLQTMKIITLRH